MPGEVVAIDGKTVRRSHDKKAGRRAIHLVSAWASANTLTLGQVKTEEKSNEITAIPKLLEMLEISGCIVTIDAMGCQKEIPRDIVDQEADYLLAVKENQGRLYQDVRDLFEQGYRIWNLLPPQRHSVFPAEAGIPGVSQLCLGKALDSRESGNDGCVRAQMRLPRHSAGKAL